jgi:very-short-patch-repair endonuclease
LDLTGPRETIKRAKRLRSTMSLPEVLLWRALRKHQTGMRFRRQHPAGPHVLDFYCDASRLCVEVDGAQHDFQQRHDTERDKWLAERGIRTLRIQAVDVLNDLDAVVRYISSQTPSDALRAPPPPMGEDF